MLTGIRDQLVGDDPELLGGRRVEGEGFDFDRDGQWGALRDAAEQGACVHWIVGLGEQPVNGRDRADPGGGLVEGPSCVAVRTAEQEEVGNGLEVVLDPVIRLFGQCALELRAGGGSLVSGRLTADRSRKHERDCYGGCYEGEPHRSRAGRAQNCATYPSHTPN